MPPASCSSSASTLISPPADAFAAFLAPLKTTSWFVYSKRPFAGPQAALAYLARYTHRVAISNRRLVALDADGVTFRYKDYRRKGQERYRTMTLVPGEFIRRFLLHVLPKGFHRIRHYGLFASTTRKANIARARAVLAAPEPPTAPDATTKRHRRSADRPSPAMPVLRRAHAHRRDLRARRRPARSAITRTRAQDRGRMTPNKASPHRKPAGGRRRRRQPDYTFVRSIRRPGPPIAPTSTGLGARDRTLRHAGRDRSANQARARARHHTGPRCRPRPSANDQIPIDPDAEPGPRGFLPWRLSNADPRRCPLRLDRPASETLHTTRRSSMTCCSAPRPRRC